MRPRTAQLSLTLLAVVVGVASVVLGDGHDMPITHTTVLAQDPTDVVMDAHMRRAFVTADGPVAGSKGSMAIFDASTATLLRTVTVGYDPRALALDEHTGQIVVVNQATLDSAGSPTGRGSLSILEAGRARVVRTITIGGGPQAVAVDRRSGHVFVVETGSRALGGGAYGPGTLRILDARTWTLLHTVQVGMYPTSVAVDAQTEHVFVTNMGSNTVSMLDARTGHLLHTAAIGPAPGTVVTVAVDVRTRRVLALSFPPRIAGGGGPDLGQVAFLNATTDRLMRTVALHNPGALAVDQRTGQILVGDATGIRVLDGTFGHVVRTIPLMLQPNAMAIDAGAARAVLVTGRSAVRDPDRWAWLPGWLRQRLPRVPPPPTQFHIVPGRVSVLDLHG